MRRNISLAYFLSFAFHSWFWMGNWIFNYLRFGNYATVVVLDSVGVMASMLAEIPTGAFTDLVGKKKALILAFFLAGTGNILMGVAGNFWMLALSLWILVCAGGAFYSGTMEALVYDSLKELGDEGTYDQKIGKLNATRLWSMAICSVIGGYAYLVYPGLPLILNGVVTLMGLVVCFWLKEPKMDTEKYDWISFFKQNMQGFKTLFANQIMTRLSSYLVVTGALLVIVYNILDDLLAVEWGYSPVQISYLFAAVALIAGLVSTFSHTISKRVNQGFVLVVSVVVMAVLLMLSPIVGMVFGGISVLLRVVMEVLYDNATSVAVNRNVGSDVRATTLSSLNLLRSIPYALSGGLIGVMVERLGGARNFGLWFGLAILLLAVPLGSRVRKDEKSLS